MKVQDVERGGLGELPLQRQKVLIPTDFSPASKKAFSFALRFVHEPFSALTLLHVLEPESPLLLGARVATAAFWEHALAETERRLQALADSAKAAGVSCITSIVRAGSVTHEILESAKELDIDLIVLAAHGLTGWKYFTIGSTAEAVARAAPCSVLVVREKEHEFL
ncbi:MAG: universal stress protein [Chthoniobacterales bacterium]|jgi:nucleotide-binding universal stress UspA family protein|nr:universal stress protein [Chthoniobacterales bacterium]